MTVLFQSSGKVDKNSVRAIKYHFFSFVMKGMELSVYVKTLDVFSLLQIEMPLLILLMLKNGQVCP